MSLDLDKKGTLKEEQYYPSGRPLAEPPIFNYDELIRDNCILSDTRLKLLFAKDIVMRYAF